MKNGQIITCQVLRIEIIGISQRNLIVLIALDSLPVSRQIRMWGTGQYQDLSLPADHIDKNIRPVIHVSHLTREFRQGDHEVLNAGLLRLEIKRNTIKKTMAINGKVLCENRR